MPDVLFCLMHGYSVLEMPANRVDPRVGSCRVENSKKNIFYMLENLFAYPNFSMFRVRSVLVLKRTTE